MARSNLGKALHTLLDDRDDLEIVLQDQVDTDNDKVSLVFLDGSSSRLGFRIFVSRPCET